MAVDPQAHPERRRDDGDKRPAAALLLIAYGEEGQLFHDERGEPYAVVVDGTAQRLLPVRSRGYQDWLRMLHFTRTGQAVNGEQLASALGVLAARAVYAGPQHTLWTRFARTQDEAWLDLADPGWRAVCVTADGWRVVNEPPPLFRRHPHQGALPEPVPGGDVREILEYLNVTREGDALLLVVSLVVALLADIPRPLLIFHGPQGSAKTTIARMMRAVVDPSAVDMVDLPREADELAQVLDHHAAPVLDNIGRLAPWQADALCRAVTGGGFSKRALYTDQDDVLLAFRRWVLLTSITVPTSQPDLLDRALLVQLERVPPDRRREETALWRAFDAARPRILGGVLDTLSAAMRVYPTLHLPALYRMADFTRWAAAVAEVLGYGAGALLDALAANAEQQVAEALDADPIADAVRALVESANEWSGTATDLLDVLTRRRGDGTRGDGWPRRPHELSRRLKTLQTPLADVGFSVAFSRSHHPRIVTLGRVGKSSSPSSLLTPDLAPQQESRDDRGDDRSQVSSPLLPFPPMPGDDGDDGDDRFRASTGSPRDALLAWGEWSRWRSLPISRGVSIVGTEEGWRAFCRMAPLAQIEAALAATRAGGGNGEVGHAQGMAP